MVWAHSRGHDNAASDDTASRIAEQRDERLSIGSTNAPVKIVEFADMLCPYCARAHKDIIPRIKQDYIAKEKAHFEMRLVAVTSPDSRRAAEAAYCAAEQDKFWDFIDTSYKITWNEFYSKDADTSEVDTFSAGKIGRIAEEIKLDRFLWQDCIDSGKYGSVIDANKQTMTELKAFGTPHYLFNEQSYNGAPPYTFFEKAIDAEYERVVDENK